MDGNGGWNRGEVFAGSRHLATYANSTTYFAHQDWLGSERVRTNVSGGVAESFAYLPFGDPVGTQGVSPVHFTGDERDSEDGLDHTRFRQYASTQGRWMTPDPLGLGAFDLSNPQSLNLYAYVVNNPVNLMDPLGLQEEGGPRDRNCSINGQLFPVSLCDLLGLTGGGTSGDCQPIFSVANGGGNVQISGPPGTCKGPGNGPDRPEKRKPKPKPTSGKILKLACSILPDVSTAGGGIDLGVAATASLQLTAAANGRSGEFSLLLTSGYSLGATAYDVYGSIGFVGNAPTNSTLESRNLSSKTYSFGIQRAGVSGPSDFSSGQITYGPSLSPVTASVTNSSTFKLLTIPLLGYVLNPTKAVCHAVE